MAFNVYSDRPEKTLHGARTFHVASAVMRLAVAVEDAAIVSVEFQTNLVAPPETPFERQVAAELEEYFGGRRTVFSVPVRTEGSAFEEAVWAAIAQIPYGETRTYGDIARQVGRPAAARAVGTAAGRNPTPIVVPCHRVVGARGRLGGFGGGTALKRWLLGLETRHRPVGRNNAGASLFGLLALVVGLSHACTDPERPVFEAGDTSGVDSLVVSLSTAVPLGITPEGFPAG